MYHIESPSMYTHLLCPRLLAMSNYTFRPEHGYFSLQNELRVHIQMLSSAEVHKPRSAWTSTSSGSCGLVFMRLLHGCRARFTGYPQHL